MGIKIAGQESGYPTDNVSMEMPVEKIKCRLRSNCMVALLKWVNAVMPTSFMYVRRWEPEEDINAFRVAFNKDMNIFNANSGLRPDWHLHHEFIRIGSPLKMSPMQHQNSHMGTSGDCWVYKRFQTAVVKCPTIYHF